MDGLVVGAKEFEEPLGCTILQACPTQNTQNIVPIGGPDLNNKKESE
jgi:hypothetical protein